MNGQFAKLLGRATPCAPPSGIRIHGAHGVTRPTCQPFVIRLLLFVISVWVFAVSLHAAPMRKSADEIPQLAPPLPEMAPSYWEQHGLWSIVISSVVTGLLLGLFSWWLRPRKPPVLIMPASQACATLAALQARPEDGAALSQISQTLRHYLIATFWLNPGETTTAEFCATLAANTQVGPELSTAISEFLKHCDERKFSPAASPTATGAARRALELVDLAEAQRARPHAAAQTPKPA